ncbi:unnamed protein product [Vitrella brassicaformis CCMP3155]|uniref:Uncharacterized protein n=2 Tax=Vitrella brassicaformis TaxID=1169539 RepID=A0A0G4ENI7_VITBC|nr:unnamed protein product [Vitrella brassicaformis CCMP3155]|eukprot:CEL98416.1 unnamed protein product [Vitrella brassicaformis CCMP3155]
MTVLRLTPTSVALLLIAVQSLLSRVRVQAKHLRRLLAREADIRRMGPDATTRHHREGEAFLTGIRRPPSPPMSAHDESARRGRHHYQLLRRLRRSSLPVLSAAAALGDGDTSEGEGECDADCRARSDEPDRQMQWSSNATAQGHHNTTAAAIERGVALNGGWVESESPHAAAADIESYGASSAPAQVAIPQSPPNVGNPQPVPPLPGLSIESILKELKAIQDTSSRKYCILGTRHCSYLHQQIIELLSYALVLSGNHVYTSGASGTNAAAVRGALRANCSELLTVILPQSFDRQVPEAQELLRKVKQIVEMPENDCLPLDEAAKRCNAKLLNHTDHLIAFAFHDSKTIIQTAQDAKTQTMLVVILFLD